VRGFIGGGQPYGEGLCINAERTSTFHLPRPASREPQTPAPPGVKSWTESREIRTRLPIHFSIEAEKISVDRRHCHQTLARARPRLSAVNADCIVFGNWSTNADPSVNDQASRVSAASVPETT
jgi:hypothetical protein